MSPVLAFRLVLLSLVVIIGLELLAKRLWLPPAAAFLVGGIAMVFIPGLPDVELDPDLVLVVFLPLLLMDGAYFSVWDEFRRSLRGIVMLAIGAVLFTTLVVGVAVHLVVPGLPWAACFALGAIVSPPDALAAKAVLERVALPRRLRALLEGDSLLNDGIRPLVFDADGKLLHPRLWEQYNYWAQLTERFEDSVFPDEERSAHFAVVLAGLAAARAELLKMHRAGQLSDELLGHLEHDLDLQEVTALHVSGGVAADRTAHAGQRLPCSPVGHDGILVLRFAAQALP